LRFAHKHLGDRVVVRDGDALKAMELPKAEVR
jgi:hypothetical protein